MAAAKKSGNGNGNGNGKEKSDTSSSKKGAKKSGSVYDLPDKEFYEEMGKLEEKAGGALAANPEAMKKMREMRKSGSKGKGAKGSAGKKTK